MGQPRGVRGYIIMIDYEKFKVLFDIISSKESIDKELILSFGHSRFNGFAKFFIKINYDNGNSYEVLYNGDIISQAVEKLKEILGPSAKYKIGEKVFYVSWTGIDISPVRSATINSVHICNDGTVRYLCISDDYHLNFMEEEIFRTKEELINYQIKSWRLVRERLE